MYIGKRIYARCCQKNVSSSALPQYCKDPNTDLISRLQILCDAGKYLDAVSLIEVQPSPFVSTSIFKDLVKFCTNKRDIAGGRRVHSLIKKSGIVSDTYVGSYLIRLFDACGSLSEAIEVFENLSRANSFAWSAIITACAKHGQGHHALILYEKMQSSAAQLDGHSVVAGLRACSDELEWTLGMLIHVQVIERGFESIVYVCNALIDMYMKCGSVNEAQAVFQNQTEKDVVTWNTMITGYAIHGMSRETFELFLHMKCNIDSYTLVGVLKACSNAVVLLEGNLAFHLIVENSLEYQLAIGSSLIDMYCKSAHVEDACSVFNMFQEHDTVIWNTLIAGLAQYDGYEIGYRLLEVFKKMRYQYCSIPDGVTCISIAKACSKIGSQSQGKFLHVLILEIGLGSDISVLNALISMYSECKNMGEVLKISSIMPVRDAVTWNAMIGGCIQNGHLENALSLVDRMQKEGKNPDIVTLNLLLRGYTLNGYGFQALALYKQIQLEGFMLDKYSYISILNTCSSIHNISIGIQVHLECLEIGILSDNFICSTVIDMYAKCGSISMAHHIFNFSSKKHVSLWNAIIGGYAQRGDHVEAYRLFQQLEQHKCAPDTVTWNSMITGLVQYGNVSEAIELFNEMLGNSSQPDNVTFLSLMKGCSLSGSVDLGRKIYTYITENCNTISLTMYNSLIDMYSRCGSIADAQFMFESLHKRDLVTWNTLIAAYALHNETKLPFKCVENMQQEGFMPDGATFSSLLSACSHAGLLNEGYQWFKNMVECQRYAPAVEHLNGLVDLFSRAGHLATAANVLKLHSDAVGWIALLNNCKTYGSLDFGKLCFDHAMEIEAFKSPACMIMSNFLDYP